MGLRVRVADPHPDPLFPPFVGVLVYKNGDAFDVETPNGDVGCFPAEWCTPVDESPSARYPRPNAPLGLTP
jgi:hypothetical protein